MRRILKIIQNLKASSNYRIKMIGIAPICNLKPHRAPHIGKFCFILCWRCSATIATLLLCQFIWFFVGKPCFDITIVTMIILSAIFIAPLVVDGILQYLFNFESTNPRRIVTGILAGLGLWICAFCSYQNFHYFEVLMLSF